MKYFRGINQSEATIFFSVDNNYNIRTSVGITYDKNDDVLSSVEGDLNDYITIILVLAKGPFECTKQNYINFLSTGKCTPLLDRYNTDDDNSYYAVLDKLIFNLYDIEVEKSSESSYTIPNIPQLEDYIICEYCFSEKVIGSAILKKDYKVHLRDQHDFTKKEINKHPAVLYKDLIDSQKVKLLTILFIEKYHDLAYEIKDLHVQLESKQIFWNSTVSILLRELNRYIEESDELNMQKSILAKEYAHKLYSNVLPSESNNQEIFKVKYDLANAENAKLLRLNKELEKQNIDLQYKLESVQKYLKAKGQVVKFSGDTLSLDVTQGLDRDAILNQNLDGSKGLHIRRESGRFGSLSSFDNYSDDFNEKFDCQDDL